MAFLHLQYGANFAKCSEYERETNRSESAGWWHHARCECSGNDDWSAQNVSNWFCYRLWSASTFVKRHFADFARDLWRGIRDTRMSDTANQYQTRPSSLAISRSTVTWYWGRPARFVCWPRSACMS